ncbi:hypothetical protein Nepgr_005795 [Nepenthes gracilis]|uniref:Uncharacterized protein n=1 Tax=Nepenthes gracilis TaxID=150966 RepID=A0AAD3S404_NEPGR|nr:hypothetical protein Nepgr_005795 [Nepenthes gracilis]
MGSENSIDHSTARISFSDDLHLREADSTPATEQVLSTSSDTNSDFDFCKLGHEEFEFPPADELFSEGIIIPVQIRKSYSGAVKSSAISASVAADGSESEVVDSTKASLIREEKRGLKSLWRFRRSSSLNGDQKKSYLSICSLPLLLRSNSAGSVSAANPKISGKNQSLNSEIKLPALSSRASSSSSLCISQRPPTSNSKKRNYGYGVRSTSSAPVLNVPPPYIAKGTSDLLGLASFFRNSKLKNTKKP